MKTILNKTLSLFLILTAISLIGISCGGEDTPEQDWIDIPDAVFEQVLISYGIDSDNTINGRISKLDAEVVTNLDIASEELTNIEGINGFINLRILYCGDNEITTFNISNLTALEELDFSEAQVSTIDLTRNLNLKKLNCSYNNLTNLDISQNINLTGLWCGGNPSPIDFSHNVNIERLGLYNDVRSTLDVSFLTDLTDLTIGSMDITDFDLSLNTALKSIVVVNNSNLTSFNIKNGSNADIVYFQVYSNNTLSNICVDTLPVPTVMSNGTSPASVTFTTTCN